MRVNSRAELVELLHAFPLQLRAARPSLPERMGHPEFVGPLLPAALRRAGSIGFDTDGAAFFVVRKGQWEEPHDQRMVAKFGEP